MWISTKYTCTSIDSFMTSDPRMDKEVINTRTVLLVLDQTLLNKVDTVLSAILEYLLLELGLFVKNSVIEF